VRKVVLFLACVLALAASPAWADPSLAAPQLHVPSGFRVSLQREIAPGLIRATLVRTDPPAVVNVAVRGAGSPAELQVVLSNGAVAGPDPRLERTSSMCSRVDCLVAVNGDFFGNATGEPVGAVVANDQLLRSPNPRHHQLSESSDGALATGQLAWRGTLVPSDLEQLSLDGVNVPRGPDELVLYTPAQGPTTAANQFGAELVMQVVRPAGPIKLRKTTLVRLVELRHAGDSPIPADGAVLSGHGRGQRELEALWARVQAETADPEALLRLDVTPDVVESIGGSPILVRNGRRWFPEESRALYTLRAPRSMAGWTATGDLLLATVDGRQAGYSVGMTMEEAAELMIGLGAVEAINLDGGGSTAFVVDGAVINRPSDRAVRRDGRTVLVKTPRAGDRVIGNIERPVAVALALVGPRGTALGGEAARASLVVPLGNPGAPVGTSSALLMSAADGSDAGGLAMVLLALSLAVFSARRRRAVPAFLPAR